MIAQASRLRRNHGDPAPAGGPPGRLEILALIHAVGLLVFTTWDFGGETDFAGRVISLWGSLAVPLIGMACRRRLARHEAWPGALKWLWPLAVFDLLVLISALNPSFAPAVLSGATALVHAGARPGWPSSARPAVALQELWQFNAIYLTGFNLVVSIGRRRNLRALLLALTANAVALAVFGTFQRLGGSAGLYFGLQPSPNEEFFATFIYHNHWAAFVLLSLAAAVGLALHYARRSDPGALRRSPVGFGLVAALLLAASVPLSASRSGSVLTLILLAAAVVHWWQGRRHADPPGRTASALPAVLLALFLAAGLAGTYLLDRPVIERRIDTTRAQIEQARRQGGIGDRAQLYADTWRLARARPWFGWGLGSYGTVFQIFNQQVSVEGWVPFYAQAHSDWLQALAEVGAVGTALLLLLALVPLAALPRRRPRDPLPVFLLTGCAMVAAYALVEFPFANPAVMLTFWLCFFAAIRYVQLDAAANA